MLISEIFYSVQGEGSLAGIPSVFIRTSGCNLRCVWCDTPYASWNPTGTEMTLEEILSAVSQHPATHVVLTGGEPMVAKGIHELAARLRELENTSPSKPPAPSPRTASPAIWHRSAPSSHTPPHRPNSPQPGRHGTSAIVGSPMSSAPGSMTATTSSSSSSAPIRMSQKSSIC